MDIFKDKRNHTQGGSKHINKPTTGQERTQGIAPFLFAYSPKGKKKLQNKTGKERQGKRTSKGEQTQKHNDKRTKAGQKDKTKGKKDKKEGKHASSL